MRRDRAVLTDWVGSSKVVNEISLSNVHGDL